MSYSDTSNRFSFSEIRTELDDLDQAMAKQSGDGGDEHHPSPPPVLVPFDKGIFGNISTRLDESVTDFDILSVREIIKKV